MNYDIIKPLILFLAVGIALIIAAVDTHMYNKKNRKE